MPYKMLEVIITLRDNVSSFPKFGFESKRQRRFSTGVGKEKSESKKWVVDFLTYILFDYFWDSGFRKYNLFRDDGKQQNSISHSQVQPRMKWKNLLTFENDATSAVQLNYLKAFFILGIIGQ